MIPVWFVWLQILVLASGLSVGMLLYPRGSQHKDALNRGNERSALGKTVGITSARIWNIILPLALLGAQAVSERAFKGVRYVKSSWAQAVNRILGRTDIDLKSPASAYLSDISQHKKESIKNIENNAVVD
jgi:hypothetical protein